MQLRGDHRSELRAATRPAAEAMVEDLQHIRNIIAKTDQKRDEIRRMSAILRRLLVENDLAAIAAPRVGRIELVSPDNTPFYKQLTPENADYFASGGAHLFGFEFRALASHHPSVSTDDFDPDRTIPLRIANFLSQRVIFWRGQWINRREVIKYVANIAQGVHSSSPKQADEKLLSEIRHQVVVGLRPNGVGIAIRPPAGEFDEATLKFTASGIDLTLIELFAAARYLTSSPSIAFLEAEIHELG